MQRWLMGPLESKRFLITLPSRSLTLTPLDEKTNFGKNVLGEIDIFRKEIALKSMSG